MFVWESILEKSCYLHHTPTLKIPRLSLILLGNFTRLPLPREEILTPRERIGDGLVCKYFAQLLKWELRSEGYSRVAQGDIRTSRVSGGGVKPEPSFM